MQSFTRTVYLRPLVALPSSATERRVFGPQTDIERRVKIGISRCLSLFVGYFGRRGGQIGAEFDWRQSAALESTAADWLERSARYSMPVLWELQSASRELSHGAEKSFGQICFELQISSLLRVHFDRSGEKCPGPAES